MPEYPEDRVCCVNCFSIREIQDHVRASGSVGDCDYCDSTGVPIRDVEEVGEFILEGVGKKYEDAANSVGYENEYLLSTTTIEEILNYEEGIFGEALDDPTALIKDLVQGNRSSYVRRDPYGPPNGEPEEINSWESFCQLVRGTRRFTALGLPEEDRSDIDHPQRFLDSLKNSLVRFCDTDIPAGQLLYRARIWNQQRRINHGDMTAPPPEKTRNNRMSPQGISFFYGALDEATAISEIRPAVGDEVAVGTFKALRSLRVMDLTFEEWVDEGPLSIFHELYAFHFEEFVKPFMKHFAGSIARPLRTTDSDLEYVPTQVLTEFLRMTVFRPLDALGWTHVKPSEKPSDGFRIDGLVYPSSLNRGGKNIVLFGGP